MKKITALILSVVLVFSLAACSNTQQNDASDPVSSEAPSHAAESTPAEVTETEPPKGQRTIRNPLLRSRKKRKAAIF